MFWHSLKLRANRDLGLLDQGSNQAQDFLLLWSVASRDQKGSDLNVRDLSTRGEIRLMPDEDPTGFRSACEQPPSPLELRQISLVRTAASCCML